MSQATDRGPSGQVSNSVLAQVMLSEEYSDMSFCCRGELFKVHKAVVCSQSSVIKAAVESGFKESERSMLSMDAFTPCAVRKFIQFLYTQDYDVADIVVGEAQPASNANASERATTAANEGATTNNNADSTDDSSTTGNDKLRCKEMDRPEMNDPIFRAILTHTRMNAMGDYYDVPALIKLANTRVNATLAGASPDAPWVPGLPVVAEAALEIVNNDGLSEVLATAVAENIGTILAMGTLEDSPLMTPFCLAVLKKCSATSQALSETLSYKIRTLNEVGTKYQKAADQALQQRRAMSLLGTTHRCRAAGCTARFECFFEADSGRLRCGVCQAKH